MRISPWLAMAALSAVTIAGPSAQADLFERLRGDAERSEAERSENDQSSRSEDESFRFAIADAGDIGKIVSPVAYQTLPAPGGQAPLAPVPEPAPAPLPAPSYGGPTPAPGYGSAMPIGPTPADGYPVPGPPPGAPYAGPLAPFGPGFPGEGFPLFSRVEYEDLDHIHPHAVPTVVQVLDPCSAKARSGLFRRHHDDCDDCGPQCVFVEICAPPGCPEIDVSRRGKKVTYDYGDYKIEILSKNGVVEVDYDD